MAEIPKEIRAERNEKCRNCEIRMFYAKRLDMHFDWTDCPYDCPNDMEHLVEEMCDEVDECTACDLCREQLILEWFANLGGRTLGEKGCGNCPINHNLDDEVEE